MLVAQVGQRRIRSAWRHVCRQSADEMTRREHRGKGNFKQNHDNERAPWHESLERRRNQIGGMLELARRLDDYRLIRFLESHKDALSRLIEVA
jgi:hypothetical protein